jgi:peptide/nickel transport system substrate-binding protein
MRDPFGMKIFRFIAFAAMFLLLCLLYWSSVLVEERLQEIKQDLSEIKAGRTTSQNPVQALEESKSSAALRTQIDPSLSNLLGSDPFYEKTLPEMLGIDFPFWGTRKTAASTRPDNLQPFSLWSDVVTWQSFCLVGVAAQKFGFFEQYCAAGAIKVEERKVVDSHDVEYWVHLRDNMVWQPLSQEWFPSHIQLAPHFLKKHPVTAFDFKLQYDAIMNPFIAAPAAVISRENYDDIVSVRVIDPLTFVVRWKTHPFPLPDGKVEYHPRYTAKGRVFAFSPLASFVYLYYPDGKKIIEDDRDPETYRNNSTFAQNFTEHWAKNVIPSCGAMCFDGMSDQMIKFVKNPDHYQPLDCLFQGFSCEFKQSMENVWLSFKQGQIDTCILQPDRILEYANFIKSPAYMLQAASGLKINKLDYIARQFVYIGWNQVRPLFSSKKVRRAMTLAIDRKRIIDRILNGKGEEVTCPFYRSSPAYDHALVSLPYDPVKARRLLEEEGFADFEGDGYLAKKTKDGLVRFEFALTYFVKDPTTKAICEYIATALKEIGVKCNLNGVDIADMSAIFDDKNFDAYYLSWAGGDPPEDLTQLWASSGAKEKGSSNAIGFANNEVDQIINALNYEYDKEKRIQLYHRFCAIFQEEMPYTLLYTPKISLLYREYLQNVFLPKDRQDLIPGAVVAEPQPTIYWLKERHEK